MRVSCRGRDACRWEFGDLSAAVDAPGVSVALDLVTAWALAKALWREVADSPVLNSVAKVDFMHLIHELLFGNPQLCAQDFPQSLIGECNATEREFKLPGFVGFGGLACVSVAALQV